MTVTASKPGLLEKVFAIKARGSSVGQEIRGGVVTFFTMAYIVVLNPLIIATQTDGSGQYLGGGDQGKAMVMVAAATALTAGVMSILMGAVANFPLALATGLGLNAFVTFSIAKLPDMTWADAMGLVVLEGIIILVLVLTGFRKAVFRAVPAQLKTAISVGIGLFITFIGFIDAGFVRKPAADGLLVQLGIGGVLRGWPLLVFVLGLGAIILMMVRKIKGALLYGIVGGTALALIVEASLHIGPQIRPDGTVNAAGWSLNVPAITGSVVATPDLGLLGQFSLLGSFSKISAVTVVLLIFSLLLADFFDTMGTMVAIGSEAKLLDADGNPPGTQRILIVDSLGAIAGGAASVSSNTAYIESASGVGAGARTGLASIITGALFLLATFFAPLVTLVPHEAATPALVVVGFLMMQQVTSIKWDDLEIAIPAFLTIVLMPFTYSITVGIGAGFVCWVAIKVVCGKVRQIHPLMWVVAAMFVIYFAIDPISQWIGG